MKKLLVIIGIMLSASLIKSQVLQNDPLMPHWLNRQGPSLVLSGKHVKQAQHDYELQEKNLKYQFNIATTRLQEFKVQLSKASKLTTHKDLTYLFATATQNLQMLEETMETLRKAIEETQTEV